MRRLESCLHGNCMCVHDKKHTIRPVEKVLGPPVWKDDDGDDDVGFSIGFLKYKVQLRAEPV